MIGAMPPEAPLAHPRQDLARSFRDGAAPRPTPDPDAAWWRLVTFLPAAVATGALLFISEAALNVWDRLKAGPPVLLYAYVGIMVLLAVTAVWLIWRLVIRRKIEAVFPRGHRRQHRRKPAAVCLTAVQRRFKPVDNLHAAGAGLGRQHTR